MMVTIAQMDVKKGRVEENLNTAVDYIEKAISQKSNLIVLPEVFTTGFDYENLQQLSKTTPHVIDQLKPLSQKITICGSMVNERASGIYNTFYVINKGTVIFSYSKTMLFPLTGEDRYFSRGGQSQKNVFHLNGVLFGASICYELRFPEFFRKAALNNIAIHLLCALWPKQRIDHWDTLIKARAIENQVFVVAVNAALSDSAGGHSAIYNPWGVRLTQISSEPFVQTVSLHLTDIEKARGIIPSLTEAKKWLY